MKKILIFLVLLLLYPSCAASTTVTIGDIFSETNATTAITINDVSDVASATIKVSYDPSVLVITDANNSDFQTFSSNLWYAGDGWIKVTAYNTGDGMSGTITFAELSISPRGDYGGCSELEMQVETLSDGNYQPINATVKNGMFCIGVTGDINASEFLEVKTPSDGGKSGGGSALPPSLLNEISDQPPATPQTYTTPSESDENEEGVVIQMDNVSLSTKEPSDTLIIIKNVGGSGLSSASIVLNYDPSIVKVESVDGGDFDEFVWNVVSDGCLKMVAYQSSAAGLKGDVRFASVKLKGVGNENKTSVLRLTAELSDNEGLTIPAELMNGHLSIKSVAPSQRDQSFASHRSPSLGFFEIFFILIVSCIFIRLHKK